MKTLKKIIKEHIEVNDGKLIIELIHPLLLFFFLYLNHFHFDYLYNKFLSNK